MELLQISKTEFTPEVTFNPVTNELVFDGVSRPENVAEFYTSIIDWVANYESLLYKNHVLGGKKYEVKIICKFSYINSASSKMIYILLESIRRVSMMGYPIEIEWHYENDDDQMREDGEELSEAIDIPFTFIES